MSLAATHPRGYTLPDTARRQGAFECFGIGDRLSIRTHSQRLDAQVYPDWYSGCGCGVRNDYLDLDGNEPMPRTLGDDGTQIVRWLSDAEYGALLFRTFLQRLAVVGVEIGILGQVAMLKEMHFTNAG